MARALTIRPGIANDDLRETVAAVDQVHGDGELPPITMISVSDLIDRRGRRADGLFLYDVEPNGQLSPRAIRVRIGAPNRHLVALHEIGHFLDLAGLPGTSFASGDPEVSPLDGWRVAIRESRAVQQLRSLSHVDDSALRQRADHLLEAEELWARSYAQFIAARSGFTMLRASLDLLRRRQVTEPSAVGTVYFPRQWEDDDFSAIDGALEHLFWSQGWIA